MTNPKSNHQPGRTLPPESLLAQVQLLLLDVDGVLTDGRVWFDHEGREYKSFHMHDASGIVYWHRGGGRSGFLSGRGGEIVHRRARELGVHEIVLDTLDKGTALAAILQRQLLTPAQVAYVGDDLLDLPVLRQVGFAVTVPEGRAEVKAVAHYITTAKAGFGAAREVVEILLRARGTFDAIVSKDGRP
jgi:3-deoxy-D-manno-octulosonate 8-phosphate phosphatase (KDO 8-P phosphatase)